YDIDVFIIFYFFFQAEDGIRDGHVTGVQTCALPISPRGQALPRMWPFSFSPEASTVSFKVYHASGFQGQGMVLSTRRCGVDSKEDRKSTRLNSSHVAISYAVFCLKKKKKKKQKIDHT